MPRTTEKTRLLKRASVAAGLGLVFAASLGCQGNRAEEPPVHLWWQMDGQNKFDAQEENDFFYPIDCADEDERIAAEQEKMKKVGHEHYEPPRRCHARAMRTPPAGTIAVGQLKNDDHLHQGRGPNGRLVDSLPSSVPLTPALLARGEP